MTASHAFSGDLEWRDGVESRLDDDFLPKDLNLDDDLSQELLWAWYQNLPSDFDQRGVF